MIAVIVAIALIANAFALGIVSFSRGTISAHVAFLGVLERYSEKGDGPMVDITDLFHEVSAAIEQKGTWKAAMKAVLFPWRQL